VDTHLTALSPTAITQDPGSGIRDPGWVNIRIRDKHPGSLKDSGYPPHSVESHDFIPDTGKTTNYLPSPLLLVLIGSGIRDPGSDILDPRSGIREPGSEINRVDTHLTALSPTAITSAEFRSVTKLFTIALGNGKKTRFKHERRIKNIGVIEYTI
jgi:hypothetical protein